MKYFFLLATALLLINCNLFGDEDNKKRDAVFPNEFKVLEKSTDHVIIRMENFCGSGCWIDYKDHISQEGNTFNLQTTIEYGKDPCLTVCVELNRDYDIKIASQGDYTFNYIVSDTVAKSLSLTF